MFTLPIVPNVMVGIRFTVPVTALFCWLAPVLMCVIFPAGVPVAVLVSLTLTEVAATVPPV